MLNNLSNQTQYHIDSYLMHMILCECIIIDKSQYMLLPYPSLRLQWDGTWYTRLGCMYMYMYHLHSILKTKGKNIAAFFSVNNLHGRNYNIHVHLIHVHVHVCMFTMCVACSNPNRKVKLCIYK